MYTKVKTGIVLLAGLLLNGCALSYINLTDLDDKKVVTEYKASQDVSRLVVTSNIPESRNENLSTSISYVWVSGSDKSVFKSDGNIRDTLYLKTGVSYKLSIWAHLFRDGKKAYTNTYWQIEDTILLPASGKDYRLLLEVSDDRKTIISRGIQPGSDL